MGFRRGVTGFGVEGAAELSGTQAGDFRELVDRERRFQILLGVVKGVLDAIGFGRDIEQRGRLRLAAGASMIDDKAPGDAASQLRAEILLNHGEHQINTGGHPRRGPDRSIGNEDAVLLNLDRRKTRLHFARDHPVRRRAPPVEQAGLGKDKGAPADRGDPARFLRG